MRTGRAVTCIAVLAGTVLNIGAVETVLRYLNRGAREPTASRDAGTEPRAVACLGQLVSMGQMFPTYGFASSREFHIGKIRL